MSSSECSLHISKKIKKRSETIYYCDYCGKGSFTRYHSNLFPVSIQYFRNNIVFQLDFHQSCFELFYNLNKLAFCSLCSNYYSKEEEL